MGETLLELKGITKQFPGVKALDNVDLDIRAGEVHAIVGENGAGKSTLIKIVSGAYKKDAGTIRFNGEELDRFTPETSLKKGISVIYQELSYLPTMSIAENIFLGSQPKTKHGLINYRVLMQKSMEIQQKVGLGDYSPRTQVSKLSTSEKQLIEIGRASARNLKLLILDEPTSALNEAEIKRLFSIIAELKKANCGIIYITHKMDEIFEIADRVTVMRDGQKILTSPIREITRDGLITAMVGREIKDLYPVKGRTIGEVVLEVENLNSGIVKDVSFNAKKGEIVGFYGLMGCGCDRAMACLFGAAPIKSGTIKIDGQEVKIHSPEDAIRHKIAYAPGDRKTEGLMLSQSVRANISCVTLGSIKKGPILDLRREKAVANKWVQQLRIKTAGIETQAVSLSGGNQQKIVLAKWLENKPKVFLMNEPTKGIDVGAKAEIYAQMEEICQSGSAVIFITSDLPELLAISDRVFVFHEGQMTGEIAKENLTQENVVKKAIGE